MKKWSKSQKGLIAGISGMSVGLYMLLVLNNKFGLIPLSIGLLLILWKYNGRSK